MLVLGAVALFLLTAQSVNASVTQNTQNMDAVNSVDPTSSYKTEPTVDKEVPSASQAISNLKTPIGEGKKMHDPALQGQTGRGRSAGRCKCECCPYGYHLDLDFVRYCEKVSASGLLQSSTVPRTHKKRRESRESLLGIGPRQLTQYSELMKIEGKQKTPELITSDDLEKAVLDFEKMFNSSTRPKKNEEAGSRMAQSLNIDVKYRTIAGDKIRDPFDEFKLNGTNNASAEILQEIRQQMAASLNKMRKLEEEVKIIPNLQHQLKKLRWENRRLIKLLETAEKKMETNEQSIKNNKFMVEVRDPSMHTRTIGTGSSVMRRDVGTSHSVVHSTTGTNPLFPGIWRFSDKTTNTALSVASKSCNTDEASMLDKSTNTITTFLANKATNTGAAYLTDKGTITNLFGPDNEQRFSHETGHKPKPATIEAGVQTITRKSFTLDFGIQTDYAVIKVPMSDASVQHNSIQQKPLYFTVGCQHDSSLINIPSIHVGVQYDLITKKTLTSNTSVQCDIKPDEIKSLKEKAVQTEKEPDREKKEIGLQNTPIFAHVGIMAKRSILDSTTQTSKIMKKDIGCAVNTTPQNPEKKNIGTSTDEFVLDKILNKKTLSSSSRLTDTTDLLKKSHVGVNTVISKIPNIATENKGLENYVKKIEYSPKPHMALKKSPESQEKVKSSSIPVYKPTVCQLRSHDKEPACEEVQEKSSPHASAVLSKPYEKKEPSKEMKGAMKVLNDNLLKSPSGDVPKNMINAVNIVQQEWFKISSTADANPLDVEDYLDCFEELSVALLEYIVNMADVSGNTAMHYAVSNGNFDVVSILLDSKVCNINKLNTAGYTCIMLVALTKVKSETDRQVVRRLLQMADVNIRARQHGQTALMLAVSHGRIDTVELLLESGADINIQDEDGSTALMCAAEHGYIDIVKLLLAQPDCDLSITDLDGNTALNIAMEAGNRDIGVLLYAQEHFSRGASPFSTLKIRRAKSATPTLKTRTPTPPNCSQEHSL